MMDYFGVGGTDEHAKRLVRSYRDWTGRDLLAVAVPPADIGFEQLFYAPMVILSHGTEPDPILNFGSRAALQLWEIDWATFTGTPSRLTAEPMNQQVREHFLQTVEDNGFVDGYTGVRISSTGKRFEIIDVTVWNVIGEAGDYAGQAAAFRQYRYL